MVNIEQQNLSSKILVNVKDLIVTCNMFEFLQMASQIAMLFTIERWSKYKLIGSKEKTH